MSSFQLGSTGDLEVVSNRLSLTEGKEAIRQHLWVRFQIFLGEWFLDTSIGVPWYRDILVKGPSFAVVSDTLKAVILETPGVTELLSFDFSYEDKRTIMLDFMCDTVEGPLSFTQTVEV